MEMIEIDVTMFMQVIEMAFHFAFYTVVGIGFVAALCMMGAMVGSLLEDRDD